MPDEKHDPVGEASSKLHDRVRLHDKHGNAIELTVIAERTVPGYVMLDGAGLLVTFHAKELRQLARLFERAADVQEAPL